jgi:hypothetical protein
MLYTAYELNKMLAPSTPHLVQKKSKPSTYKQENHHHPIALRSGVAWRSEGHDRSTAMVMSPATSTSQATTMLCSYGFVLQPQIILYLSILTPKSTKQYTNLIIILDKVKPHERKKKEESEVSVRLRDRMPGVP